MDQLPFVAKARKTGFDILEVRAQKIARMSKAELDTLKTVAAEAGLGLTYSIGMTDDNGLGIGGCGNTKERDCFAPGSLPIDETHGRHGNGRNQLAIALVRDKWMARLWLKRT